MVPAELACRALVTADLDEAAAVLRRGASPTATRGSSSRRLDAPYDAGRRGSAWVKVKPRHTLDLVVLAVEWGSGRRQGWLSNIHLGARDPATGGFVMLGKTFKGMTDEMLAWQTERFLGLEVDPRGPRTSSTVRPEQVVEIAFDGVQRSTRYPGGVALRFARVLRYRDDKTRRRGRHRRDGAGAASRRLRRGRLAGHGRGRIRPSWATVATSRPSSVNTRPMARPRAPDADGETWS